MLPLPAPGFGQFKSALAVSLVSPHPAPDLAALAAVAAALVGEELVAAYSVFVARGHVLAAAGLEAEPAGSVAWLDLVFSRVQSVTPTLLAVDRQAPALFAAAATTQQLLLDQVRQALLSTAVKKRLAQALFLDFSSASPASSAGRRRLTFQLTALTWVVHLEAHLIDELCDAVRQHVKATCAGAFEQELLSSMLHWVDQVALAFVSELIVPQALANARRRVEFFVHETFASLRIGELFDMVTAFPDSTPALNDLKICLARTHQSTELTAAFGQALERRLLHPGANTNSILIVYVRTIKALRILDPSGMLLEAVQESVCLYLRSRPETVRCVVMALTNDGSNSELFAELGLESAGDVRPLEFDHEIELAEELQEEEEELGRGEDGSNNARARGGKAWEPDPIEADPSSSSKSRRTHDILSMLVRIYGSMQVFVSEYRTLLADRLLKSTDFDVDAELRSLELLKLRFGEAALHLCGLMIKDVADSRRINANIKLPFFPLEAVVASRISWPQFQGESFRPHHLVRRAVRAYTKRFAELKKLRRIQWKHHVGTVELLVSVPGSEPRKYQVAPLLANLLAHLADRPEWTLPQLAQAMRLDEDVTRKRMAFWVSEGVVLGTPRGYAAATVLERAAAMGGAAGLNEDDDLMMLDEDEAGAREASLDSSSAARDEAHAQFVAHMLTNLGGLTAESIHRNLQMFSGAMGEHAYDRSEQDLEAFLQSLVGKGAIERLGDLFQAQP